ncbi:MAG: rod shape-determining protein RodA [Lachnospiraceae bacterium]|nr:rod shape-determining protein RodA [Lachnospiraceae bacterium]
MPKKYKLKNFDFLLVIFAIAISTYGIFIIGSAREAYQKRQSIGLLIGVIVMLIAAFIDYSTVLIFHWFYYIASTVLLLAVVVQGRGSHGATRWINIAGIQFQPSSMAKLLLILFFAKLIMKYRAKMKRTGVIFLMLGFFLPQWYLIYREPDLSTSIVFFLIFASMILIGGISWKFIIAVLSVTVPLSVLGIMLILSPNQEIIKGYQQDRILAWLQPDKYASTEGYQQQNSIVAIGSGMLRGKGYKNNEVGSVKNGNFIAEPQTDFIFAIVGEELGFIGSMTIIILDFLIVLEILKIGWGSSDMSGTLICSGVAAHIGFQTFMNIAVTTGLMPNTGIPLPFVSYGLTELICLFIEIGVVLNVGLLRERDNVRLFE